MIRRVNSAAELEGLIEAAAPPELVGTGMTAAEWLAEPRNIALRNGDDLGMFEHFGDGVYDSHCFCVSRGKDALASTRAALREMFDRYGAASIYTETPMDVPDPLTAKRTLLFARRVGFRPVRETERPIGRVTFSVFDRTALGEQRKP